jgi:hypothetical protein
LRYVPDKHHQRYGIILSEESRQGMLEAVRKAKKTMEPSNDPIPKEELLMAVETIREAVMEAYPAYL